MNNKILALGAIVILVLLVACNNKTTDIKEDVYDIQNNVSVEDNNDDSQQVMPSTKGLSQIEIVKLLEEKRYLVHKFKIPYDEYRDIYMKYCKKDEGIDDTFLYVGVIYPDAGPLTMRDFIGKDMEETKEYWEDYLDYPLEDYLKIVDEQDEFMNIIEISQVYEDYSNDWTHVYVQKKAQGSSVVNYGRAKYTFEKINNEYKIVHMQDSWDTSLFKKDTKKFTKEEFNSIIESKRLYKDKNYIEVIDLKTLVGKTSKEESWDYLFNE